jgi:branched-chain amino acid transport system permease protein
MFSEFVINGLLTGLGYVPVACGLALVFSVTGVFNFSHGIFYVMAGTLAYLLVEVTHFGPGLSFLLALGVTVFFGYIVSACAFHPLQKKGASGSALMIASIGLLILLQNAWLLVQGNGKLSLRYDYLTKAPVLANLYSLTLSQFLAVPVSVICLALAVTLLRRTDLGRSMRAVSSNRNLAIEQGLDVRLTDVIAFAAGAGLASVSGFLDLLDPGVGIDPIKTLRITLISSVAVLAGGRHSLVGTALACVVLGVVRSLSIWLTQENWSDAVTAALLIVFVCVRPAGIAGRAAVMGGV